MPTWIASTSTSCCASTASRRKVPARTRTDLSYKGLTVVRRSRAHRGLMQKHLLVLSVLAAACSTTAIAKPPVSPVPQDGATVAELAQHRAQLIGWLHEYREAGVFPVDATGMPMSAFKDAAGVRCPMAELLHKSGRDDLVDAVAKEANTVRLEDVHTGPLHDWMLGSGLTEEEISMVQGAMNISNEWMPQETEHGSSILAAKA